MTEGWAKSKSLRFVFIPGSCGDGADILLCPGKIDPVFLVLLADALNKIHFLLPGFLRGVTCVEADCDDLVIIAR